MRDLRQFDEALYRLAFFVAWLLPSLVMAQTSGLPADGSKGAALSEQARKPMTKAAQAFGQSGSDQPVAFRLGGIEFLDDASDVVTFGGGAFNIVPNDSRDNTEAELRLEYRLGKKWYAVGPMAGIATNTEGGVFAYVALYTEMRPAAHWIITPAAGLGAYERGDGKDLGGVFQFHLGLDVAYRFENGDRLGLKLAHVSNASINDENPGSESLLLTYTLSLGRFDSFF